MHGCKGTLFKLILGFDLYVLIINLKFQFLKQLSNIFCEKTICLPSISVYSWYASGTGQFSFLGCMDYYTLFFGSMFCHFPCL